jgi:predicted Zn finger-like uncharacterized protein
MIKFPCPGCQTIFTVTDDKAGKKGKCPKCQTPFTIPQPDAAAPPPPPLDPSAPIEIEPCPGCGAVLTVAAEFLGADVECPSCNTVFTAAKPGAKPKSKSVVSVPPPPAPTPASAFSGLGDEGGEDEAPKPKKGKGKAPVDDDEDDAPKKKKKGKSDEEDEDFDDEDDYDDKPKGKKQKNGMLLAAGIVHIVFALGLLGCGGGFSFCGGAAVGASTVDPQIEKNNQMAKDNPFLKENKAFQDALKKQNDIVSAAKTFATVITIIGVGYVLVGILGMVAGLGCIMRKPFGKLLTFAAGPLGVLLGFLGILLPLVVLPSDAPTGGPMGVYGGITFFTMIYAGFTIFAALKGYKKEAGGATPKKDDDEDADAEDAEAPEEEPAPKKSKKKPVEEDEDDLPPPPKKSKKKPVEEDEEDDLPPPPKKSKKKPVEEDEDDEDEAPKPKKKKPRRDDDD